MSFEWQAFDGRIMPRVTIGLPVHNGENYLDIAVRSILDQTFEDFELILSDNASTDGTAAICERHAAADRRVRYHRFDRNMGAAHNFNHLVDLAQGDYFKWAAHDDVCGPEYLAHCVEMMDADPNVVLCHTRSARIDTQGNQDGVYDYGVRYDTDHPCDRFGDLVVIRHHCINVFGLIRPEVLRATGRIGSYVASDRVLLAELALHGKLVEVPEVHFYRRMHPDASSALDEHGDRLAWFDPDLAGRIVLPNWRVLREYIRVLGRAPIGAKDRWACWRQLARHVRSRQRYLRRDLSVAAKMLLNRSPFGRKVFLTIKRIVKPNGPVSTS